MKSLLPPSAVKRLLPQDGPLQLITRVLTNADQTMVSEYNVPLDPIWAKHHFPGHPIQPGVFGIEMGAQATILYAYLTEPKGSLKGLFPVLKKARDWEFRLPVYPGDRLKIVLSNANISRKVCVATVEISLGGKAVATGKITGAFVPKESLERK